MKNKIHYKSIGLALLGASALLASSIGYSSSHREAPLITETPKLDGTDFYMFNSYESGRKGFVTLLANYIPLQDAFAGPNYFTLDSSAFYSIHIDNNGDAKPDITFRFKFRNKLKGLKIKAGKANVAIPLINIGPIGANRDDTDNLNVLESYSVKMIRHGVSAKFLADIETGHRHFKKPVDNIGNKSLPNYDSYAQSHIYTVNIPNCGIGKVFVGQRKEGFAISLGNVFDLVNTNPLGPIDGEKNALANKNITTLALEIPAKCLVSKSATIGAWTTATKISYVKIRKHGRIKKLGPFFSQKSRLGSPLVNEIVIGLKDKNKFNRSKPKNDTQFASYVTNPSFPSLLQALFNVPAPSNFPRNDLVAAFLTGIKGLNNTGPIPSEMLRLNTSISATKAESQNNLGVIGRDLAGFPNGRRPGDDIVDIILRVAMGRLCHPIIIDSATVLNLGLCKPEQAPVGTAPLTDGVTVSSKDFDTQFPYLKTPIAGASK